MRCHAIICGIRQARHTHSTEYRNKRKHKRKIEREQEKRKKNRRIKVLAVVPPCRGCGRHLKMASWEKLSQNRPPLLAVGNQYSSSRYILRSKRVSLPDTPYRTAVLFSKGAKQLELEWFRPSETGLQFAPKGWLTVNIDYRVFI